jgi:Glycosyl transferases group 1
MIRDTTPRILVFSQRNISRGLFQCPHHEFEDLICHIDSAEVFAPSANPSSLRYRVAKGLAYRLPFTMNPGIRRPEARMQYDLFFTVCGKPSDLLALDASLNWRQLCSTSVCLIDEFWARQIEQQRHFFRILDKFDVVMLYYCQTVEPLGNRITPKCFFLPPGVDTLLFSPYPRPPRRAIDVYSIGRRSELTHHTLLRMADQNDFFYVHDSIAGNGALDSVQHRALVANMAKRSRYFIVNPGLIDKPEITGNQSEIGNRYFEGAASGTIMIGERPKNQEFAKLFDWPDALIDMPYDSHDIVGIINKLDRQPERQDQIRRANVSQALLRHDWAYRWEAVLQSVGLAPMPQLAERKRHLQSLAQSVSNANTAVKTA